MLAESRSDKPLDINDRLCIQRACRFQNIERGTHSGCPLTEPTSHETGKCRSRPLVNRARSSVHEIVLTIYRSVARGIGCLARLGNCRIHVCIYVLYIIMNGCSDDLRYLHYIMYLIC